MRNIVSRGPALDDAVIAFSLAHRDAPVLTAWIAGEMADPGDRRARALALRAAIAECRRAQAGAPHAERKAFEAAVATLEANLPVDADVHAVAGMVMFATPGGHTLVRSVTGAPVPSVTWQVGPRLAPWFATAPLPPAIVVVADRQHATLHRLDGAALSLLEHVDTSPSVEPVRHMGSAPQLGFHVGTRGGTQRDSADRRRRESRVRHAAGIAQRITVHAGQDMDVVIGGVRETADLIADDLPAAFAGRIGRFVLGRSEAGGPAIVAASQRALRELDAMRQDAFISHLLDGPDVTGHTARGAVAVVHALAQGAVDHVVVSPGFARTHAVQADQIVLQALAEHAVVEIAHAAPAATLDAQSDGIVARLRFPVNQPEVAVR
jgi:hypothetical protein